MADTYSPCPSCGGVNRVLVGSRQKPVCGRCGTALALDGAVSQVTSEGLETLIRASPRPVVVDFWAEWCGPCKMFAPVFQAVASELSDTYTFAKVDTESQQGAAQRYAVRSIPTLILFEKGREARRQAGAAGAEAFKAWLQQPSASH